MSVQACMHMLSRRDGDAIQVEAGGQLCRVQGLTELFVSDLVATPGRGQCRLSLKAFTALPCPLQPQAVAAAGEVEKQDYC